MQYQFMQLDGCVRLALMMDLSVIDAAAGWSFCHFDLSWLPWHQPITYYFFRAYLVIYIIRSLFFIPLLLCYCLMMCSFLSSWRSWWILMHSMHGMSTLIKEQGYLVGDLNEDPLYRLTSWSNRVAKLSIVHKRANYIVDLPAYLTSMTCDTRILWGYIAISNKNI